MSAIIGLINLNNQPVDRVYLERMRTALAAHTTDGGGMWLQGCVGLGQGLICFTPEDRLERQPLISRDGQRMLVCTARLDNRPELMRDLDISPIHARELPDSVFILRAYETWGEACVSHLVGAFVFAVWNAHTQSLLIARSPMGERVLFYHRTPQTFAFATMPKGLLALPFVSRELNEERLADFLVRHDRDSSATFYRTISQLPPGHLLTVGHEEVKVRCYWQLDLNREIRFPRDDDYVEAFNELFERVVGDHLRSTTPVGVFMSGGLDSTSIAATAARLLQAQGKRLAAFTEVPRASFDGPFFVDRYADETPFVEAVAQLHENLDLNLVRTDGLIFLHDLDRLFAYAEVPFPNTSNRVWWEAILQRASSQGIRVMLTGMQGNLTMSWDGSGLLVQLLRQGRLGRALHEAQALASSGEARSALRALVGQGVMPQLPIPLWAAIQRLRGKLKESPDDPWHAYSPIHPDLVAAQKLEAQDMDINSPYLSRFRADTRRLRYHVATTVDIGSDLDTGYQAMFGIETRSPTADVRLLEFCLALPEEQYLRDGQPRWLIRRAMADRLPPKVLENRKRGLQAADWYERLSAARETLQAELAGLERSELARRVLDLPRLRRLFEQWPRDGWDELQTYIDYCRVLESGLMAGRFLCWFERGG